MISFVLPRLQIIVLAAGFSARLGRPKALMRVHGLSLIRRTVQVVASIPHHRIFVVVPPRAARYGREVRHCAVRQITNPKRALGLSTSVRCGIRQAWYSAAVLLLPVDLVRLDRRDLLRLIARWQAGRRLVVATRVGSHCRGRGAPLILPRYLYPRALQIVGDGGLRELVGTLPADRVALVHLPSAAADLDTVQDLWQSRRRFTAPTSDSRGKLAARRRF